MRFYDTDQEQSEALHAWWQTHKVRVMIGVLLIFATLWGTMAYQRHQQNQQEQASLAYFTWQSDAHRPHNQTWLAQGKALISQHSHSPYAAMAKMMLAKYHTTKGQFAQAIALYQGLSQQSKFPGIQAVATTRLAEVYLNQHQPKQALATLQRLDPTLFPSRINELQADAALQRHQLERAYDVYQAAIDACPPGEAWQAYSTRLRRKQANVFLKPIAKTKSAT